jgi:hypothetical protein
MTRKKGPPEGAGTEWMERLMAMTAESPLLLVGTVLSRHKMSGNGPRGPWEFFKVKVRGIDGRTQVAVINDPATVPEKGAAIILPVFVGQNGNLREARNLGEPF